MGRSKKSFAAIFLCVTLFLAIGLFPGTMVFADEPTGTISGKVSLPEGRTVPEGGLGVRVLIHDDNGTPENHMDDSLVNEINLTLTNDKKEVDYTVEVPINNNGSKYRVSYNSESSTDSFMDVGYYSGNGTQMYINYATGVDAGATNIDLQLIPACIVTGTISLPDGHAAPTGGLKIEVWVRYYKDDGIVHVSDKEDITIVEGASSAEYKIKVMSGNEFEYTVSANPSEDSDFLRTYSGFIECSLEICPNVNIVLDIAKKISGTISLPNKELAPKGGIMISVSASDGARNSGSSFVTIPYNTNCSTYTVKIPANSLGSGYRVSYGIITSQEKYMDYIYYSVSGATTSYSKATLVDVSSSSATGIDVELMPAKIISGRISLPNGDVAPEGGIRIIVSAINEAGNNGSSSVTIPCGENSATYTVNVPANNPEDGYRITYFVLTP